MTRSATDYVIGESVTSRARTITEADLLAWSGLVHDFTSLHVDAEMMKESVFGERIAHGYIAFCLSVGLFFPTQRDWYAPTAEVTTQAWTNVRFTAPVRIGDTLRCRRTVAEIEPAAVGVAITHVVEMFN